MLTIGFEVGFRLRSIPLCGPRAGLAETFAGKLDAVCVVNEAIENGVGIGRIAHHLMPLLDGQLACDDHRAGCA